MGDVNLDVEYLSIGANRQTAAGDWSVDGTVAYGADTNIALWRPNDPLPKGVVKLLRGHKALVKAVKFLPSRPDDEPQTARYLVSGGDDNCVKLWRLEGAAAQSSGASSSSCVQTVQDHTAPINCIATLKPGQHSSQAEHTIFATGAADATIKIWSFNGAEIKVLQTIKTAAPKYFPLTVALSPLGNAGCDYILASAGTRDIIQIYTGTSTGDFKLQATLTGHEGWIRCLDFTLETPSSSPNSDLLLASASQDKYIRLWRVHQGTELPTQASTASDPTIGAYLPGKSPSNKAHRFTTASVDPTDYSVTFEALLFNHDDWIYSAKWHANTSTSSTTTTLQLLSTSADNSLAIWEQDPDSGIWLTTARLGEISREKGATTATGSIGGFWTGLWSPTGTSLLVLGRTGSWRRWDWDPATASWTQHISVSGHVRSVTGIAWAPAGEYLLSTSADQTTRLHAPWATRRDDDGASDQTTTTTTWHELARPQIHGYDLNCIDVLSATRFVSGAEEKLMRVFDEPRAVARMLHAVAGIGDEQQVLGDGGPAANMPDAANMPVLGLSNKATVEDENDDNNPEAATINNPMDPSTNRDAVIARKPAPAATAAQHPPFEEMLSRHTLWPEVEKLYGHGYELSCLAASHDGRLVASACKASSLNHAVIRLFETERWTELRPPLAVHTLTATRLRFSRDDRFLLSVGRDRQWAVFERREDEEAGFVLAQAEAKGHSRMILDAAWAPELPEGKRVFATAGRDKNIKVWATGPEGKFGLAVTIADQQPVTAVDFLPVQNHEGQVVLASGNEAGRIQIHALKVDVAEVTLLSSRSVHTDLCLPKAVLQLAWRPASGKEDENRHELAIAGDDSSLRIYKIETF